MKNIVIIGAGGIGRETANLIEEINQKSPTWNLIGFLDDNEKIHNTYINGFKVLGGTDLIHNLADAYVTCAIAGFEVKRKVVGKVAAAGRKFANIVHPSVNISKTSSIGEGVIIYPGVVMTTNINIGNHVILSPGCGIGHETVIEDFCSLLWNVNISGNVRIETGCLLGTRSCVIQNINIGKETIIGAGTVVLRDLPERCTAVGVPAKIIKFN